MTPGMIGAGIVGALGCDLIMAGGTFIAGTWLREHFGKKKPIPEHPLDNRMFTSIRETRKCSFSQSLP